MYTCWRHPGEAARRGTAAVWVSHFRKSIKLEMKGKMKRKEGKRIIGRPGEEYSGHTFGIKHEA